MPVSVIVGGQFGSEGKGKVTLELVRRATENKVAVVRVGGPNSGHTGYAKNGQRYALRQLPAGCIDRNVDVVFPAGSYIDVSVLLKEIELLQYPKNKIHISRFANIVTQAHKNWETKAKLTKAIGSTGSGVGAAVMSSIARGASSFPLAAIHAEEIDDLASFVCDTTQFLRGILSRKGRVFIEGSQGFGLSLLDGGYWPKATSRSTTASAAVMEAGISPMDVDQVVMVLRSYPIRVAGDSGPLYGEVSWSEVANISGIERDLSEFTTVTKKLRRVGKFDSELVKRAIEANNPTHIVMNHLDYLGNVTEVENSNSLVGKFIQQVESSIERKLDGLGFSEFEFIDSPKIVA